MKTELHDITEILLKVMLNTINQPTYKMRIKLGNLHWNYICSNRLLHNFFLLFFMFSTDKDLHLQNLHYAYKTYFSKKWMTWSTSFNVLEKFNLQYYILRYLDYFSFIFVSGRNCVHWGYYHIFLYLQTQ